MKTGKREEKGGTRGREDGRVGEGRRKKKKNRPPEDRYRAPLWKKGRAGKNEGTKRKRSWRREWRLEEEEEEEAEGKEKEKLRGRGSLRYDTVSPAV